MPFFSGVDKELIGLYPMEMRKDDCIFCSCTGNCGSECVEWCPLVDEED